MKAIHKFKLPDTLGFVEINVPVLSRALFVGLQENDIVVWISVETTNTPLPMRLYVAFTGQELPEEISDSSFLGTVQKDGLEYHVLMQHIFNP